jgi:hypothetical protein
MADLTRIAFPTCGRCLHWAKVEFSAGAMIGEKVRGVCFGSPPTVRGVFDGKGNMIGQGNMRPMMPENERACGLFLPLELPSDGANDLNG